MDVKDGSLFKCNMEFPTWIHSGRGFEINLKETTPEIRNILVDTHSDNLGPTYLNITV